MEDSNKSKLRIRWVFFGIFLVLTIAFLVGAILGGIANQDDIINTIAIALGFTTFICLILTITFGIQISRLKKENNIDN